MFCPKCGSLLTVKKADAKKKKGEELKKILACSSCDYTSDSVDSASTVLTEKVERTKEDEVTVIEEDPQLGTLPLTDTECPKCSHLKAYFWTVQTRAADEPETKFFKCEKCSHTWRDYD